MDGGGNSLKLTYVEGWGGGGGGGGRGGGVHVNQTRTNKDKQGGGGAGEGSKIGNFERTYFLNAPLVVS